MTKPAARARDDDLFLVFALGAPAALVVTCDRNRLDLGTFRNICNFEPCKALVLISNRCHPRHLWTHWVAAPSRCVPRIAAERCNNGPLLGPPDAVARIPTLLSRLR